ncbi:hypothetical protein C8R43DRAFT_1238534 [Mycena crocata]|nr:hypothetical protein C8R43DRAFT_1238534 [Mycena crocata]
MLNGSLHMFYGGPSTYFDASRSPSFDPIALGLTGTVDLVRFFADLSAGTRDLGMRNCVGVHNPLND